MAELVLALCLILKWASGSARAWLLAEPPAPAAGLEAPPAPLAPAPDAWRLGSYRLAGLASVGMRWRDVDGSEAQFDEDSNLEEGFVLRELGIEGTAEPGAGPVDSFLLDASGVGDPASYYRAEADLGEWRAFARYQRSVFEGNSDSDIHPFDVSRRSAVLGVESGGGEGVRSLLELSYMDRDGLFVGTRSFGFEFISGFPVREEERRLGARGDLLLELGESELSLTAGIERLRADDRWTFAEAPPSFPGETVTEDFDAGTKGLNASGEARIRRAFRDGSLEADLGLRWQRSDVEGDLSSNETGFFFDPASPFVRDTEGDLDLVDRRVEADLGLVQDLGGSESISLRYTFAREELTGDLSKTVTLDELTGDPPTVSQFQDTNDSSSDLQQVEVAWRRPLFARAEIELGGSYGSEQLEVDQVVDGVTTRFFDDRVDRYGAEAALYVDAGRDLEFDVSAAYGQVPTESARVGVLFTFDDERSTQVGAGARWRPLERWMLSARARFEFHESEATIDSESDVGRYSFSATANPLDGLSLHAGFDYMDYDRRAETTFLFFGPGGIVELPAVVSFDGIQRVWTASAEWEVAPAFRPRLDLSAASSGGDSEFDYSSLGLDLPFGLPFDAEFGAEWSFVDFEADGALSDSTYDAAVLVLYFTQRF